MKKGNKRDYAKTRGRLGDAEVRMVRVMFMYKWSRRDIAKKMGINYWSVCNILDGKYYVGRGEM